MAERPARHSMPAMPPSRSQSQRSAVSRLSLTTPINVFSDDFALAPLEISPASSATVTPTEESTPVVQATSQSNLINASQNPDVLARHPSLPRNSTSKRSFSQRHGTADRTQSTVSRASIATSGAHRASSISSHFSIPRAPSPYQGATGPSHPYQMYPQITRTSSVSTIRPHEGAFVGSNGPEHPYGMYPQNTVPEEDAAETVAPMIPVGFPGMAQNYQRQVGSEGEDVADIIGPDGHLEQLPPYTRYPDEVPRKIAIETADLPLASSTSSSNPRDVALSEMSTLNEQPRTGAESNTPSEETTNPAKDTFAEKIKRNGKRRICCGLPLYLILGVVGMIVIAGTIGGVIGGVVAGRRPKHHGPGPDGQSSNPTTGAAATAATTTVTTTSWMDATPITSSTVLAAVPTGHYQVSLADVTSSMDSCIADTAFTGTWACEPPIGLGIDIEDLTANSNVNAKQIILNPYPITANASYGAQPPDLEGKPQTLLPYYDKDAPDLGPALFFWDEYNKTIILPENAISASSKRSVSEAMLYERQYWHRKNEVSAGDRPWLCFWNNTIIEFFIYVGQNTSSTSSSSAATTTAAESVAAATSTAVAASSSAGTYKRSMDINRRDGDSDFDSVYPRYVKIEEKRKPTGNIPPYCVQVEIDSGGSYFTPAGAATVTISEVEPTSTSASSATTAAGSAKFRKLARGVDEPEARQIRPLRPRQTASLDSYCSCEWLST